MIQSVWYAWWAVWLQGTESCKLVAHLWGFRRAESRESRNVFDLFSYEEWKRAAMITTGCTVQIWRPDWICYRDLRQDHLTYDGNGMLNKGMLKYDYGLYYFTTFLWQQPPSQNIIGWILTYNICTINIKAEACIGEESYYGSYLMPKKQMFLFGILARLPTWEDLAFHLTARPLC